MPRETFRADRALGPREQAMLSTASRVGLSDEPGVIQKALELERLLNTRLTAGGGFSDTCRNILCLDLASSTLDVPADKVAMIKQSGLKRSSYQSARGAAENLLQMKSDLSVAGACVKLQCVSSQELAVKILTEYGKIQRIDQTNPQYVCMAIYQACRISKIKVLKVKLLSLSGLKPTQWARLEEPWTKFVDDKFAKDKSGTFTLTPDSAIAQCVNDVEMRELETKEKSQTESYDTWKKRILTEAYRELKQLEKSETVLKNDKDKRKSPRKRSEIENCEIKEDSCRKSPRKNLNPTATMDRSRGVRLLF